MSEIRVPELSLVVLIGPSGSGKSTFARRFFLPTEVLSSDYFRGLVSDDENDQTATVDAFEALHHVAAKRLARRKLVVVDATNVQPESRRPLLQLARQYHCLPVAIVLDLPETVCHERNRGRADRDFGVHVVRNQRSQLRRSLKALKREGFRQVFVLHSAEEVDGATLLRTPLWNDRRGETGPFDIIGDVHGCCDELEELLAALGYEPGELDAGNDVWGSRVFRHPQGRRAVFVGDLVDRGPRVLDVLRLVRNMVVRGSAFCVPGNHDAKLLRKLGGAQVRVAHGLAQTLEEIEALPDELRPRLCAELATFLDSLVSHYVFDAGRLVVAHAGMKEEMQGRASGKVREFALYGETTGETDEFGLPVRMNWAAEYRGDAMVVYGHTPVPKPEWLNRTVNVDTGCVFGGALTALRYPEREFVSVPARKTYCEPARPFLQSPDGEPTGANASGQEVALDAQDVLGKRIVATRLAGNVTIREENAAAALEAMSRFAADPRWLIYLPPTMSPPATSSEPGLLEHPAEAFEYFRSEGVASVVCEEKHMGSRAVVIVCRDEEAARERFLVSSGETGIVYTRTGRRFFTDAATETELLARLRAALDGTNFWETFGTSWACFDCELMPWSAKAQELLRSQYAAVGAAGSASVPAAIQALERAASHQVGEERERLSALEGAYRVQASNVTRFVEAYRRYCWPVAGISDLKLAPFHLLATEGKTYFDRSHVWHMESIAEICRADADVLLATRWRTVDLASSESEADAVEWWRESTAAGGEGMVVKPIDFVATRGGRAVQPAVKCRGPEYLRIIYSPDYDLPENLQRLRSRGLGPKRSLAMREFALGVESMERFVAREPLRRVHECVFATLALESEPVDPRL